MLFQNSCVVPFGITASVMVLPGAPAAAVFFEPASPQPSAARTMSVATAERRSVVNEGLRKIDVPRRSTMRRPPNVQTGRAMHQSSEDHDALHVVGAAVIAGER